MDRIREIQASEANARCSDAEEAAPMPAPLQERPRPTQDSPSASRPAFVPVDGALPHQTPPHPSHLGRSDVLPSPPPSAGEPEGSSPSPSGDPIRHNGNANAWRDTAIRVSPAKRTPAAQPTGPRRWGNDHQPQAHLTQQEKHSPSTRQWHGFTRLHPAQGSRSPNRALTAVTTRLVAMPSDTSRKR